MRNETEVRAALEAARTAYREAAPAEREPLAAAVEQLSAELSATIAAGAEPCATCGNVPHGMLRTPAVGRTPAIYEVGCLVCPPVAEPDADSGEPRTVSVAALGLSAAGAVAAWNASRFV